MYVSLYFCLIHLEQGYFTLQCIHPRMPIYGVMLHDNKERGPRNSLSNSPLYGMIATYQCHAHRQVCGEWNYQFRRRHMLIYGHFRGTPSLAPPTRAVLSVSPPLSHPHIFIDGVFTGTTCLFGSYKELFLTFFPCPFVPPQVFIWHVLTHSLT